MGIGGRKPLLPAPTESLVDESTAEEREVIEEVATDLSQRTDRSDRTHHTIPEDGSPITISANRPTSKISKITKSTQNSQTSLLIEYFEAGKGSDPNRRPSVRVKVIPSSRNKAQVKGDGEVVLTEAREGAGRNSRRFSLASGALPADSEISILESLHIPDSQRSGPLDIEIEQTSDLSSMSASPELRYMVAPSDISSMPADSMLGAQQSTLFAPPPRVMDGSNLSSIPAEESVLGASELHETTNLKPPVMPRERSASSERITQKVIEKLSNKPRAEVKSVYGQGSKSSSRTGSHDVVSPTYERAAMKAKNFRDTESTLSPSEISNSVLSDRSARSAVTNNSINNPKLLQTVEDAIRRLILPELKELKKDQRKHSGSKYDQYSDLSENSVVREKSARRSTSAEKSRRRRSSKEQRDHSDSRRRRSSQRDVDYDSMSDASSRREASISTISADNPKKSHRARNTAAVDSVGAGLTAAALEARESEESLHRKKRGKRSKSRSSRSASMADSDEIFHKHKVPPMPMQSDINSDLTRSSILSSNTAISRTPTQYEVQDVTRGAPKELLSPATNTPPRQSGHSLGMHHGNFSEHNLSSQKLAYEQADDETLSPETDRYHSFSAEDLLEDPDRMRAYERNLHTQHPIRRGLSPIQSVASYQTTDPNRNSMMRKSADSIASMKRRQQQLKEEVSISSFTSASPNLSKMRPAGINLENRSEIMRQHDEPLSPEFQSIGIHDRFGDAEHHRDSYVSERSIDEKRFSGITDTSSDFQSVDKLTAGQHVVDVREIRPEVVPVPFGVESGVASLVEPSILSQRSVSPQKSSFVQERPSDQSLSRNMVGKHSNQSLPRKLVDARMTSPLKDHMSVKSEASQQKQYIDLSPPQSPARSYEEHQQDYVQHHSHSPLPAEGIKGSPESEITTNPSVIHGPIGGLAASQDPWLETPTMPSASRDFSSGAINLIPEGLNVSQRHTFESKPNTYVIGGAPKDEGYATGDGDNYSPAPLMKTGPSGVAAYEFDDELDDPFSTRQKQHMSGFSQGMSPLYDTATGKGIDRIQSKDIVHLMEHLTVRDAQRNARDTEILVTLVRTAAEMRNNFEEMRAFITDQDAMIMDTADKQHEHTQKVVGGPRQTSSRAPPSQEDLPTKRRNVFKRALQGLGSKNTAELQNIESMLMQLLDEVEGLRSQQVSAQPHSIASEEARPPTDTGYEPEGRAGTASSGGSAFFSNTSKQQFSAAKRIPENRVSVVMEGDEEDYARTPQPGSPTYQRGHSEPLHTPPRMHDENEITPRSTFSSDKKSKTFSSFLPNKFVSRWSKTTASTELEHKKPRPYSGISRSGSDLQEYDYDPTPDDRLRSATSLQDEAYYREQANRPPSPLVPSTLSTEPKYQAHRNSQNLQHPQPRQGPTGRNQWTLENAAQMYHGENVEQLSPVSQASMPWPSNALATPGRNKQNHMPHSLSPISDTGSRTSSVSSLTRRTNGPPRPPKVNESEMSEPLVPQRPSKIPHSNSLGGPGTMSPSTYVDDVRAARAGSPAFDRSPIAAVRSGDRVVGRKPSGPRPLSASSNRGMEKRARFTNSPAQSIGEEY